MSSIATSQEPALVPLHSDRDLEDLRRDFRETVERNLDAAANRMSASRLATVSFLSFACCLLHENAACSFP